MTSYASQVAAIHKRFNAQIKRAKSRRALQSAYTKHKADHGRILKRHLKEEMATVKRLKNKI